MTSRNECAEALSRPDRRPPGAHGGDRGQPSPGSLL